MTKPRLLALAVCAAAAFPLAGASPAAAAGRTCSPGKYPGQGYFTSLKAYNISCTGARSVELGHYRCRIRHGGIKGRCTSFNGWRCTESRKGIATEYNARVTCSKGTRKVVYTYQQNT